jgi:hypothetical protein
MSDVVWIHYARPRTPWYELSDEERSAHLSDWTRARRQSLEAGAQHLGDFHVRGQSDYSTAEVWTFGSAEDAFDHWARLTATGYAEWFAFANNVGLRKETGS